MGRYKNKYRLYYFFVFGRVFFRFVPRSLTWPDTGHSQYTPEHQHRHLFQLSDESLTILLLLRSVSASLAAAIATLSTRTHALQQAFG